MTIREQIHRLPFPERVRQRILELTIFAQSYELDKDHSKFNMPQAFSWNETREGGMYWLELYARLENYNPENEIQDL
jgi:hypothetical protein